MKIVIPILMGCVLTGCVNGYFESIRGLSPREIREEMGEPTTVLTENNHQMWTYKSGDCTQMFFFGPQETVEDWQSFGDCETQG